MSKSFNTPQHYEFHNNESNVRNNNTNLRNFIMPNQTQLNNSAVYESQQAHQRRLQPNLGHQQSAAFPIANNSQSPHVQLASTPFLHQNAQQVQNLLHQFQHKYAPTHASIPSSQYSGNVNYQHQPNNASGFPMNERGGNLSVENNWYSNGVSGYQHQHQNLQSRSNNHVHVSESLLNKFPSFAPYNIENHHSNGFVTVPSNNSNNFQPVIPVKLPSLASLFSEKAPMHSQLSPFLSDKHQGVPPTVEHPQVTSVVNEEFMRRAEAPITNNFQRYAPAYEQAAPIPKLPPYPPSGNHVISPATPSTGASTVSNSVRELSSKSSPAGSSDTDIAFTDSPSSWANSSFMITMNNMTNGGDGAATRAARDEYHDLSSSDDEADDEPTGASPAQRKKGKQLAPKSRKLKKKTSLSRKTVNFDQMAKLFIFTEAEAAEKLGISKSKLKRLKKKMNIQRWPFRRLQSLKKEIASVKNLIQVANSTGDSKESIQALNQRLYDLELTVQFIRANPNTITKYKNEAIIKMIRTAQKVAVRNLLNSSSDEPKQGIADMTPEEVFKHVFATPPILDQLEGDTAMSDEQNSMERQSTSSSSSGSSGSSPSEQSTPPTPSIANLSIAKT